MQHDDAYLADMWLAGHKVLRYVEGVSWEEFLANDMLQDAVTRQVQVIGEAARSLGDHVRSVHPGIPWSAIVGMRHHLVHRYFDVDLARVWEVATRHLQVLIAALEPLVPEEVRSSGNGSGGP